jgi:carboxypeptidase T
MPLSTLCRLGSRSLLSTVFLLSTQGLAATPQPSQVWVEARLPAERALLQSMAMGFSEQSDSGWVRMDGDELGMAQLRASGLRWRPAEPARLLPSAYHSPSAMVEAMESIAERYPERVRLIDLGSSTEGRPILALRISDSESPSRQWRIAGAHHGDETVSAELSLAIAERLAEPGDAELDALLTDTAVWVIPHINPDGVASLSRYSGSGVDLNRNYGYAWSAGEFRAGSGPFSEPETRSLRALSAWQHFGGGISIHAGATNLGWVWNFTTTPSPDAVLAQALASAYAETCTQTGFYITNGAEWYITHGDTTDWAYGRHGTLDYTLEVSGTKNPGSTQMVQAIEDHLPAVLDTLAWPWWIQGQVVDASTGRGIPATVTIGDAGIPIIAGPDGTFSRPSSSAATRLVVSAPGHEDVSIEVDPTSSDFAVIGLDPTGIVLSTPSPALLSPTGAGRFSLDVETESVILYRAGEDIAVASRDDSEWVVDPSVLSPGPWTLITDAGIVERSLFIGAAADAPTVDSVTPLDSGRWRIAGSGFGRGTRAWTIGGTDRAMVTVQVESESDEELIVLLDEPGEDGMRVDLMLLSQGRQIPILSIGDMSDTGSPMGTDTGPSDTGTSAPSDSGQDTSGPAEPDTGAPNGRGKLTACACSSTAEHSGGGYPAALLLVSLIPWTRRRRQS